MADYNINAVTRKVSYSGSAGFGPYSFSFEVLDETDVAVYKNATLLALTTDYTVTVNLNGTGSVTLVSAATAADTIVILGARDIERTTDFVTAGDLRASSLNEQLDSLTIFDQQIDERVDRAIRAPAYDVGASMELPAKADRAGRVLGFDLTSGDPTISTITLANLESLQLAQATTNNAGSLFYDPAGTGAQQTTVQAALRRMIHVDDFGADPTGAADSTTAIQAAIDYASTLVESQGDGSGDDINGATVYFRGRYKVTEPITVFTSNIRLEGQGGATIFASMQNTTGYNGAKPVFIIGDDGWLASGGIGGANKYQSIDNINIVRDNTASTFIGVLVSGTRNFSASNMLIEAGLIGMLFENTSEANVQQISTIGCNYGFVCDNRASRAQSDSVRNIANSDNDVSSNMFTMCTTYYAQHTGFLFLNSGGNTINGMTVGAPGENPSGAPPLGFPTADAGIHICGTSNDSNWTRSNLIQGIVFEPKPDRDSDCFRIDSGTNNEPVIGVTIDSCHVQTYAQHPAPNITTFMRVIETSPGDIQNIKVRDSGFTFQVTGYFYGNFIEVEGSPDVVLDRCYPYASFATSVMSPTVTILEEEVLQRTDLSSFPPTGWSSSGTTTGVSVEGGATGTPLSIKFDGDAGAITMSEILVYREYKSEFAYVFLSFEARGDADLIVTAEVNGQVDTLSSTKNGTNNSRYSNAIIDQNVTSDTTYRKFFFTFQAFSASYGFDNVEWTIGKAATAGTSEFIEVKNVKIGYLKGHAGPYNPFS